MKAAASLMDKLGLLVNPQPRGFPGPCAVCGSEKGFVEVLDPTTTELIEYLCSWCMAWSYNQRERIERAARAKRLVAGRPPPQEIRERIERARGRAGPNS